MREVGEDRLGGCAQPHPTRIVVSLVEELPELFQEHLVIGEDHVLLAAELAEERRAGDAGRPLAICSTDVWSNP